MKIKINDGLYKFQFDDLLELKWVCAASDIFEAKEMVLSAFKRKIDEEITSMLLKYCNMRDGVELKRCIHDNITCYADNLNVFYCKDCGADVTR